MFKKVQSFISVAIEWLIYLSVFLIPLIFIPQVSSVFTTPKLYAFRAITLVIIFLWGIGLLVGRKVNFRWSKVFWLFVLYGLISIVTTYFSVNVWSSLFGIYGRFIGIFTIINLLLWSFIVFNEINTREKIFNVLRVSVATALLIALYGILQYMDLFVNIFYWTQDPLERAFGTIGHSNHTAAYLGINLVILIGLIRTCSFGWKKIFYWVGLGLLSLAIIFTASRGGLFATAFALVLWLVYGLGTKGFRKDLKKYGKVVISILAVLLIGGILFRGQLMKLPIVERSLVTVNFLQEGNVPDRVSWWMSTLEMIKDKPFLGHGLSTYRDVYNKYRRADYITPDDSQDNITPQSAHNEYLTIAAAQVVIGLAAYLAIIIAVFVSARSFMRRAKDWEDRVIAYAISMGIVVYLAQVVISFGVVTTLFVLYTLFGLLLSMTHIDKKPRVKELGILFRGLGAAVIFTFVVVGCVFSFSSLAAEYHYRQAGYNFSGRDIEHVLDHYKKAIFYMPKVSEYYEGYGDFLFKLGVSMPEGTQEPYLMDALDKYDRSILINDNLPHVHMNRGLVYSRLSIEMAEKNPPLANLFKDISIEALDNSIKNARNNPMYTYKKAEFFNFYERYGEAMQAYQDTLLIRNPYKDAAEKFTEIEEKLSLSSE